MKIWVCIKVVEGDEPEPIVETRVALSEHDACMKLLELWDDNPWSEDWNPFSLAKTISSEGENFYVEEHEIEAVPKTEFEKCVVPGTLCIGNTPIEEALSLIAPKVERNTERFKRPMEGEGVD